MCPQKNLRNMVKIVLILLPIFACLSSESYAFVFDNWKSGQSISNICEKAQRREIKLYKSASGLNSDGLAATVLKMANKSVSCQNLNHGTQVSYEKELFDKPFAVTLHFTPKNKQLKFLEIVWSELSLKQLQKRTYDKDFVDKILAALTEKYGPPQLIKERSQEDLFENYSCAWDIEKRNGKRDFIIFDATFNKVELKYIDEYYMNLTEKEEKQIELEKIREEEIQELRDMEVF